MPPNASLACSEPIFKECGDGKKALFLERVSGNALKNSAKPATQYRHTMDFGNQSEAKYILWVEGEGSAKIKFAEENYADTGLIALENKPCIFKNKGLMKVEVIGNLKKFQLEPGETSTRFIDTEKYQSRPYDTLTIDIPSSVTIL